MRAEEAIWIGSQLARMAPRTVLDLGSSTDDFRTRQKPHIDARIHQPLRAQGARVVCADLKDGPGVDISGDIYCEHVQAALRQIAPDVMLCCNIFEHVEDRTSFATICDKILPRDARIIITAPLSYPYHPDPIDTLYRPRAEDLVDLFPDYEIEAAETITSTSYASELGGPLDLARVFAKCLLIRGGVDATRARAHRLRWLLRPYTLSAAVLRKP